MKFNEIIIYIKDIVFDTAIKVSETGFFQENKKGLFIGIVVATAIFLVKENKFVKEILGEAKYKSENKELLQRVDEVMADNNVDFERAKQIIITDEIIENLRITNKSWFLKDDRLVYQGQRISLCDKEVGLIVGDFIGIINSDVDGYDDLYVMRIIKDNSIRQAPISFVKEDTINVYN